MIQTLSELPVGQSAEIDSLDFSGLWRRRMMDLGFMAGQSVTALQVGPLGDPVAYEIRGAVIALRRCDAGRIRIRSG